MRIFLVYHVAVKSTTSTSLRAPGDITVVSLTADSHSSSLWSPTTCPSFERRLATGSEPAVASAAVGVALVVLGGFGTVSSEEPSCEIPKKERSSCR
jgi:hypothetical protein